MDIYRYQDFGARGMETTTEIKVDPEKKLNPGDLRVLIVEDEEANIAVVQQILELMLGIEHVFAARDGHEGIRMAYELEPNLILMDLSLPKLNGWEVTRSLKSNPRFKQVPILALTAHAMVGDREKALEAGCDDYFAKPIEVDEFLAFLQPYLGQAQRNR
jgi:two-component system cell cycle response regulator DivK